MPTNGSSAEPILRARGIVKRFPGVLADDHVDLDLYPGEVLALLDSAAATELTRGVRAQAARLRARLPEYDAAAELATAERLFRELDAQFHVGLVLAQRGEIDEASETFERLGATAATASLASRQSLA